MRDGSLQLLPGIAGIGEEETKEALIAAPSAERGLTKMDRRPLLGRRRRQLNVRNWVSSAVGRLTTNLSHSGTRV